MHLNIKNNSYQQIWSLIIILWVLKTIKGTNAIKCILKSKNGSKTELKIHIYVVAYTSESNLQFIDLVRLNKLCKV